MKAPEYDPDNNLNDKTAVNNFIVKYNDNVTYGVTNKVTNQMEKIQEKQPNYPVQTIGNLHL